LGSDSQSTEVVVGGNIVAILKNVTPDQIGVGDAIFIEA